MGEGVELDNLEKCPKNPEVTFSSILCNFAAKKMRASMLFLALQGGGVVQGNPPSPVRPPMPYAWGTLS